MRPARSRTDPPSIADVVHRAAEVVDPAGDSEGVSDLRRRFEDRDEPVTAADDFAALMAEVKGAIDPQDEDPTVVMAAAVATYLAFRRDELGRERDDLLRLAARAEFDGSPPEPAAGWLAAEGIEL